VGEAEVDQVAKTPDERRALLDSALKRYGAGGWRVEDRSDFQATVTHGKDFSRLSHVFQSLMMLCHSKQEPQGRPAAGVRRRLLTIDEQGSLVDQDV